MDVPTFYLVWMVRADIVYTCFELADGVANVFPFELYEVGQILAIHPGAIITRSLPWGLGYDATIEADFSHRLTLWVAQVEGALFVAKHDVMTGFDLDAV
ncbi:hypothetical protein [Desulfosoma sp.]